MAYAMTDEADEAATFLGMLFGHLEDGVVAISQPRNPEGDGGGLHTDYVSLEELDAPLGLEARSTWFGCATRKRMLPSYERGGRDECQEVPALWADIDIHDPAAHAKGALPKTAEAAMELVRRFPLAPSALVHTGHGLQAWWFLDEAMMATTYSERWQRRWGWNLQAAVDRLNAELAAAGIATRLDRLDPVWNVDRIMRLPGTVNTKVPGAPAPVRLVELHPGRRYSLTELDEAQAELPEEVRPEGTWQPHAAIVAPGVELPGQEYATKVPVEAELARAGWSHDGGRYWRRPGKDDGHSAEVFADGFVRIYSDSWLDAHPAARGEDGAPRNLSSFAFGAVERYPQLGFVEACSAFAEQLEGLGYGTPAADRGATVQDAIRSLLPAQGGTERHLALVPAPGAEMATTMPEEERRGSWRRIDLLDVRRMPDDMRPRPTILPVLGLGAGLLYPAKLHMVVGESESGKSWLALLACRDVLRCGGTVLFLDFEDDERSLEERLTLLQVTDEELGRFAYIRPDGPLFTLGRGGQPAIHAENMGDFRQELEDLGRVELIVLDGINEVLGLHGLSMNQATEVAVLYNTLMRPLAKHYGAAVVGIDHLAKDKDSRARGDAIGSQHKRAACDVMLTVVKVRPFARGSDGLAKVRVSKDRPGQLRALCEDTDRRELAEFRLSSTEVEVAASLEKAKAMSPMDLTNPHLDHVHHYVLGHHGCSGREVEGNVQGRAEDIREALSTLEQLGHIAKRPSGRKGGGFGYWPGEREREDTGNRVLPLSFDETSEGE
jgi:hypothetical protein